MTPWDGTVPQRYDGSMNGTRIHAGLVLWAVVTMALGGPRSAVAEPCGAPDPEDRSDANLPAGLESVRWGMSGAVVQLLRGQEMVRYGDTSNEDIYQLDEPAVDDDAAIVTIRYTFYQDRLMEVTQYLNRDYIGLTESNLLVPYTEEYGPFTHKETQRGGSTSQEVRLRPILSRCWTWCDRFTEVLLLRNLENNEITIRRTSRLLLDQLQTDTESARQADEWSRVRDLPTD
jgi:hypothetical protein